MSTETRSCYKKCDRIKHSLQKLFENYPNWEDMRELESTLPNLDSETGQVLHLAHSL